MEIWAETGMQPYVAASVTEAVTFIHDHGGAVFAAAVGFENPGVTALFDKLRRDIKASPVGVEGECLEVTDRRLYAAKESGRNKVVIS